MKEKVIKLGGYKELISHLNWEEDKKQELLELLEIKATAESQFCKGAEELGLKPTIRTMYHLSEERFEVSFCSMSFGSVRPKDIEHVKEIIGKSAYKEVRSIEAIVDFAQEVVESGDVDMLIETLQLVKYGRELIRDISSEELKKMAEKDAANISGVVELAKKMVSDK